MLAGAEIPPANLGKNDEIHSGHGRRAHRSLTSPGRACDCRLALALALALTFALDLDERAMAAGVQQPLGGALDHARIAAQILARPGFQRARLLSPEQ